jgi:hypothetical protein
MYHLAQLNIAHLLEPIDSPLLEDFVGDLDRINGIAEQSKGFVWRLKDETSDNATSINPFPDANIIVNMSVWESIEDLKEFTYRSGHVQVFMKRAKWFYAPKEAHYVLWWIKKGEMPTPEEAKDRLYHLREHGETAFAFSFKKVFDCDNT